MYLLFTGFRYSGRHHGPRGSSRAHAPLLDADPARIYLAFYPYFHRTVLRNIRYFRSLPARVFEDAPALFFMLSYRPRNQYGRWAGLWCGNVLHIPIPSLRAAIFPPNLRHFGDISGNHDLHCGNAPWRCPCSFHNTTRVVTGIFCHMTTRALTSRIPFSGYR